MNATAQECATDALNSANFCAAIESQAIELEPFHDSVAYQYQNLAYVAAGVRPDDTDGAVQKKVKSFLDSNMPRLLCRPVNFVPQGGNILKLAVSRQADPFIDDAIRVWRLNLNQIDRVDNGTVLDYIEQKKTDAGSNLRLVKIYHGYYIRFRAAGAKHAAELN